MKKLPRLEFTTVVAPEEYEIEKQISDMVIRSNREQCAYVLMDSGKVLGLYQAYLKLKRAKK